MRGDPVRHPERARQERPVGVLDEQQPARDERRGRAEARARDRRAAPPAGSAQLERETDARPPPRDVVVEVAVQPLEPRVEVRREGDEEQLDVERRRARRSGRAAAAGASRRPPRRPRRPAPARPASRPMPLTGGAGTSGPRGASSSASTCGSRDVQAAEAVVRVGVVRAPTIDGGADARLDQRQPGAEVRERRIGGRARRWRRPRRRWPGAVDLGGRLRPRSPAARRLGSRPRPAGGRAHGRRCL